MSESVMSAPAMYTASIPALKRMLGNLKTILNKAEAYAAAKKIAPETMLGSRLIVDMLPLVRHVQITSDQAKGCAARLAGIPVPKFEDNEITFADLQARIEKTIVFVDSVQPAQFADGATREIELQAGGKTFNFLGEAYLHNWVLPNFYFHITTTYAILRANGLDIGKADFLGGQ